MVAFHSFQSLTNNSHLLSYTNSINKILTNLLLILCLGSVCLIQRKIKKYKMNVNPLGNTSPDLNEISTYLTTILCRIKKVSRETSFLRRCSTHLPNVPFSPLKAIEFLSDEIIFFSCQPLFTTKSSLAAIVLPGPNVEFFNPKLRSELEKKDAEIIRKTGQKGAAPGGDTWVWLTSYSRIPVSIGLEWSEQVVG